jgi:DNA-binding beta-propeller fold protein YncE
MIRSPWLRAAVLGLGLGLALGCGRRGEEPAWRLHVAQFRLPYGQSRLLNYDYPQLTLAGEEQLGSLSTRLAVTPGGEELWAGSEASSDLFVFGEAGDSIVGRVVLGAAVGAIAFDAAGRHCLVAHGAVISSARDDSVATLIDVATRTPRRAFRTGSNPRAICFDPAGGRAFVGNTGDSTLSVLDLELGDTVDSLTVGAAPADISVDPLGRWLYVACLGAPTATGRARGAVQVLTLPSLEPLAQLTAGEHPSRVTPLPGGNRIVVSELKVAPTDAPRLRIYTVAADGAGRPSFTLWREIEAGDNPLAGGMSPDGRLFAVPDFAECRLALVDLEKGRLLRWLQLPGARGDHFAVDAVFTRAGSSPASRPPAADAAPADSL